MVDTADKRDRTVRWPITREGKEVIPISQVAQGIYAVGPLQSFPLSPNAPYLVVGNEWCAIVEPGDAHQPHTLLEAIKEIGVDQNCIRYIIPSHIHIHHCSAINVLLKEIPDSKVVVHPTAVRNLMDPTKLNQSTKGIFGVRTCPTLDPVPEDRIMPVRDGTVLDLGGRELEIFHAPGHATHHIAIFDHLTRALWPGDNISFNNVATKRGRVGIAAPMFDADAAVETFRRLRALHPSMLLSWQGSLAFYPADHYLHTAEDDLIATTDIIHEGMKQKKTAEEIQADIKAYHDSLGIVITEQEEYEQQGRIPVGLVNWLKKKYPELEAPAGMKGDTTRERNQQAISGETSAA
ncbi:MAG: MBL fold metallo-hydrolase [Dehalococcoidales bacterium]|nr:MBL fold metallo-hydrolase [Dehalococcoidales bacterium]